MSVKIPSSKQSFDTMQTGNLSHHKAYRPLVHAIRRATSLPTNPSTVYCGRGAYNGVNKLLQMSTANRRHSWNAVLVELRRYSSAPRLSSVKILPALVNAIATSELGRSLEGVMCPVRQTNRDLDYWLMGINCQNAALQELTGDGISISSEDTEANSIDGRMMDATSELPTILDRFLSDDGPWSSYITNHNA